MMNGVELNILKFLRQTLKVPGKDRQNGYYVGNNRKRKMDPVYENGEKRKRSSNFHTQEIDTLLALVKKDKRTIECKKTDQITNTYKDMAWKKIAHTFNDRNLIKRSDKQLRSKWETLKKNARREHTANKLSELSEKVMNILDLDDDDFDIPLQLKEEPFFDDMTYEHTENLNEMDQQILVNQEQQQECIGKEVFQSKVQHTSNSSINNKPFEEASSQESEGTTTILPQNVQWKPIITQAFVAPSGLLIPPSLSRTEDENHANIAKERIYDISVPPALDVLDTMNTKIILSKTLSYSRGTQCDNTKSSKRRFFKRSYCCHFFTGGNFQYLRRKLLLEENKRKKEKHQIEMDILNIELLVKKRQLEKLE